MLRTKRYLRLATASQGKWGTAVWIHRRKGLFSSAAGPAHVDENDIDVVEETPRLLVLRVSVMNVIVYLLAAHCPYEAKNQDWQGFLASLETHLLRAKRADLVVLGIDANGRVPGNVDGITGPVECGSPDPIGKRLTAALAQAKMWLPATYRHLHPDEDKTFVHPTGSEHRIDYIALNANSLRLQVRSQVCENFDTGAPREDHRLVGTRMRGVLQAAKRRAALWRPSYDRPKVMSDQGRQILHEACRGFQPPSWAVSPDLHCQQIQEMLQTTLQQHFQCDRKSSNATYIPDAIWELRAAKLHLKRRTRGRVRLWTDLVAWAFRKWKDDADVGMQILIRKEGLLYHLAAAGIRFATARISKGVAATRAQVLRRAKSAGLGGAAAQRKKRALPTLLHPTTGASVGTRDERDAVVLEHFGRQEQGSVIPVGDFIEHTAAPIPTEEVEWRLEYLPSVTEVQNVMRATPRGKAPGLDNLPGEVFASAHQELAALYHPLVIKSMVMTKQPTQWRGGVLYEAYKNSGTCTDVTKFRSLFVSSTVGKCYHRLVKDKVRQQTHDFLHPLHCGPKQKAPVLFPEMYIMSHVRRCTKGSLNYAVLFLDTKNAYYSIARELAVGDICRDATVVAIFRRFNLGPDALHELMSVVREGGFMHQAGVPEALRQVVRDLHYNTWFCTRYADGSRVCQTYAGSRPGESFADTIFACIYSKLLCTIYESAAAENLAFALPADLSAGIFGDGRQGEEHLSWDGTWADDSAFPVAANNCEDLFVKVTRLVAVVLGSCKDFGLIPNMKVGKTSLMLQAKGDGAVKLKRRYFCDGEPGTMIVEARHRIALATQAYDASAKLLLNRKDLALPVRVGLFNTTVTPSLFNLGLWVPSGKAWSLLNNAYSRLVRRLLSPSIPGERIFRVPLPVVHAATKCWKLGLVARRARLSLLVSLVNVGPELLWAALQAEKTWLGAVQDDLLWLTEPNRSEWPPSGSSSLATMGGLSTKPPCQFQAACSPATPSRACS
eukprot:s4183_g6.t2